MRRRAPQSVPERQRAALATLSTGGAAIAGAGVGILVSAPLAELAWPALGLGLVVHVFGMVGSRRAMSAAGYAPARWQQAAYWLCWLVVLLLILLFVWRLLD